MHTMASRQRSKKWLLTALVAGGLTPALALSATASGGASHQATSSPASARSSSNQSFNVYGRAELFRDGRRIATPFFGAMQVDSSFVDPKLGIVGRITSMTVHFPVLPEVPAFNEILTQGPEISGITPLKYDVNLVNAKGEALQFQFTTVQSPTVFPGFGTPMGSLVNFQGGTFMQGSNTGALSIGAGGSPIFLQNFSGRIFPANFGGHEDQHGQDGGGAG